MRHAIGVDLGGSHVMAAVVDEGGEVRAKHERDITDHEPRAVFKAVDKVVAQALDDSKGAEIAGIGVGSPGNIDPATGTIRYSPNFGWVDVPLGAHLGETFPHPVFIANDARCATLGEYAFGIGRGTKDFVLMTLGTGIGGGIVAEGELLIGRGAAAGEFGHHQIRATDGFICGCGKTGCFEAQASGTGLLRHAFRLAPSFPRSTLLAGDPEKLGTKEVRKAAEAGDPHARATWRAWIDDLSIGVANVIAFVNPEMIALGGGVSSAGAFMLDALLPLVAQRVTMAPPGTQIVAASLGNDAGAVGAATVALRGGLRTKVAAAAI